MNITALFASIAVALSHLRSAMDKHLFDDQKREIDAAVIGLREAESHLQEAIAADVSDAVGPAVAAAISAFATTFQASVDDLSARLTATNADLDGFKVVVGDGLNGLNSALQALVAPPPAVDGDSTTSGAGGDTLLGGQGADSIPAGVGEDTVIAGGGGDSLDAGSGDDTLLGGQGEDSLGGGAQDPATPPDETAPPPTGDEDPAAPPAADEGAGEPAVEPPQS